MNKWDRRVGFGKYKLALVFYCSKASLLTISSLLHQAWEVMEQLLYNDWKIKVQLTNYIYFYFSQSNQKVTTLCFQRGESALEIIFIKGKWLVVTKKVIHMWWKNYFPVFHITEDLLSSVSINKTKHFVYL